MEHNWFEEESHLDELLFGELDDQTQKLVRSVHHLDCGCALLRCLSERSQEWLTAEDIAFHVKSSPACVGSSLQGLSELGLVRRWDILEIPFWGLATSPRQRRRVQTLCTWRNHWQALLTRVEKLVEGDR
jgi:hypothetical protein